MSDQILKELTIPYLASISKLTSVSEKNEEMKVVMVQYSIVQNEDCEDKISDFWQSEHSSEPRETKDTRKEIVDVIINILQVLTLREGLRQLETKIEKM